MWLQYCRRTALLAYLGEEGCAGILHLPMILSSEADQEQVTEVDTFIAVSIPVVNGIDLNSSHDQPWPGFGEDINIYRFPEPRLIRNYR